ELGAVIEQEYVDAGESARSAQRDQLQQMLTDIKTMKPDYVIVHKIDRLARNREDDIAINLLLKRHGVTLISCTENIDDTPTGKLLYGLMAEIAQFYSGNLALEVMKGLVRKAEEGGTPYRAPLGYLNRRETRNSVEYSWVELDPERAEIIRWCLEQYATGEWSAIDLTLAAQAKGLTSRPTATTPGGPIGLTTIYHMLANPYYMGVVSYRGIHYEGKHPALVEPDVWLAVQDVLAAHNHVGEKDRTHPHYLRGTIFCSSCGARLVFSQNTGRGGTYQYFMCLKKKTKQNNCHRPAVRLERIENSIAGFYANFHLPPERAEQIREAVREELASQQDESARSLKRALKRKQRVQDERQKLLQAHYAGAVPQDLLASEMKRLTRELVEADVEITAAKASSSHVEATLTAALTAAGNCQAAYLTAPDHVRRQINQGFFEKLFISEDGSVERYELTEPFAALLDSGNTIIMPALTRPEDTAQASQNAPGAPISPETIEDITDRTRPVQRVPGDVRRPGRCSGQ
ncbi:MAG TPA: recombinase family protein, partial [Actinophytocola sp.]|uniref:recombinase family protein n=1 Tax=Actinophytocola sp. TaxID=1872138 RepID=UPI002DF94EAE|nr:recombinase family protein [Actinophytocola sp.]